MEELEKERMRSLHDACLAAGIAACAGSGLEADEAVAYGRAVALEVLYQYPIITQEVEAYIRTADLPPVIQ